MKSALKVLLFFAIGRAITLLAADSALDARGRQFIAFENLTAFTNDSGSQTGTVVLTSPEIAAQIAFNEVVVSWNIAASAGSYAIVQARAIYPDRKSKFYTLAKWSNDTDLFPRQSVPHQRDGDGDVSTDTLALKSPARRLQLRVTLGGDTNSLPKFLGISLADSSATPVPLPPDKAAWGKVIPVPELTQMAYPNGKTLCSPTTVCMLMQYWAERLQRPELKHGVPEIVQRVYDSQWPGAGNWPFNMAYAGSFEGMRAYVARFSDVAELEAWIADGIPVGLSVDYDRLRGKGPGPNGHLVVCVGFTQSGDPIINDPGTSRNVQKIFTRKNLIYAWSASHNTVYLIYPKNISIPADKFGHWDSPKTRWRREIK